MAALTKADITEKLASEEWLNKLDAKEVVENIFEEIRQVLEKGEQVKLSGFGNFDLKDKRSRPGRNPKTGELVLVTERRVVTFKAGTKLKLRIGNASLIENTGNFRKDSLMSVESNAGLGRVNNENFD